MKRLQTHLPPTLHVSLKQHALVSGITLQRLHDRALNAFFVYRADGLIRSQACSYHFCQKSDPLINIMATDSVVKQLDSIVLHDDVFIRHLLYTAFDRFAQEHHLMHLIE